MSYDSKLLYFPYTKKTLGKRDSRFKSKWPLLIQEELRYPKAIQICLHDIGEALYVAKENGLDTHKILKAIEETIDGYNRVRDPRRS